MESPRHGRRRLALPVRLGIGAIFAVLFGAPGCSHGSLVGSCLGLDQFTNCKGGPVDDSVPCGGGGPTACQTAADCPDAKSACGKAACEKGVCAVEATAQKGASCEDHGGKVCDGDGSCVECLASTDCVTGTACVRTTCGDNHTCETTNQKEGLTCADHGGTVCDGVGKCVECNEKGDCPQPETACLVTSGCDAHSCSTSVKTAGAACTDHGGNVCDDAGHCFGAATAFIGDGYACSITTRGGAVCWGANGSGQLGDGTMMDQPFPVPVAGLNSGMKHLAAGHFQTCGINGEGAVKCWGLAQLLGTANPSAPLGPNDVPGLTKDAVSVGAYGAIGFPPEGDTCVALSSGAVKCWGSNDGSWMGPAATLPQKTPVVIPGLDSIESLSVGSEFLCGVTKSGGVVCMGANGAGQLGDGTGNDSTTAVAAEDLDRGATKVATAYSHACAVVQSAVWCWGSDDHGQLGQGLSGDYSLTPVEVTGMDAVDVAVGESYSCAVTAAGAAFCWGNNNSGQLGDGTTTDRTTPVAVSGAGSGVKAIVAAHYQTCAVFTDGHMACWGGGALGDGTGMGSSTPVNVHGL